MSLYEISLYVKIWHFRMLIDIYECLARAHKNFRFPGDSMFKEISNIGFVTDVYKNLSNLNILLQTLFIKFTIVYFFTKK